MEPSSYDRSSNNKSRGRRPFDKSSYRSSFPLRCTSTEKLHSKAKQDIERRQMQLDELKSSVMGSSDRQYPI